MWVVGQARVNFSKGDIGALERKKGFEPSTPSLARRCSTTEPLPPGRLLRRLSTGAEGQNRTVDTGIFSAVLYQLSYLGRFNLY